MNFFVDILKQRHQIYTMAVEKIERKKKKKKKRLKKVLLTKKKPRKICRNITFMEVILPMITVSFRLEIIGKITRNGCGEHKSCTDPKRA